MSELTRAGLQKLKEKIRKTEDELKETLRAKGEAAETGGNVWHDNFSFEQLAEKARGLSQRLAELKNQLANAEVAAPGYKTSSPSGSEVKISSSVSIAFEDGTEKTFTVGDPETADPEKGVISYESPLGKALIGGKTGEEKKYKAGGRIYKVKILKVS
jgi:transcription elongation factor GreA